jgi:hypothetical protein
MAPPTEDEQALWLSTTDFVPFDRLVKTRTPMLITDVDPIPEPDEQGRRKLPIGRKMTWEGVVDPSESGVLFERFFGLIRDQAGPSLTQSLHGGAAAMILDTQGPLRLPPIV